MVILDKTNMQLEKDLNTLLASDHKDSKIVQVDNTRLPRYFCILCILPKALSFFSSQFVVSELNNVGK